jgi:hypothetical protein
MKYKWNGPATSIEVWSDDYETSLFTGFVSTGEDIPFDFDEGSEQLKGWLAFDLITPVEPAAAEPASAAASPKNSAASKQTGTKGDAING